MIEVQGHLVIALHTSSSSYLLPSLKPILGLNIFIDIQTSKTPIQMDINKMIKMEFIQ